MKIFLHIGHFKTATTTIQKALSANRDLLREHGIVYPEGSPNLPFQQGALLARIGSGASPRLLDKTMADAHASGAGSLILSAEGLSNAYDSCGAKLIKYLRQHGEVVVIYAIRDWVSYLPSRYGQNIKRGDSWTWSEYLEGCRESFGRNRDFNFGINISAFMSDPTVDSRIVVYDHDVAAATWRQMNLPEPLIQILSHTSARENQSFTPEDTELLRLFNAEFNDQIGRARNAKFASLCECTPPWQEKSLKHLIGLSSRNSLMRITLSCPACREPMLGHQSMSMRKPGAGSKPVCRSCPARSKNITHQNYRP